MIKMKQRYLMQPVRDEATIGAVLEIFRSNPSYFQLTKADFPVRNDVLEAIAEKPEDVLPEQKHAMLILRRVGQESDPVGTADWLDDFPENGTRYLGLFMTKAAIHGTGESRQILDWLMDDFVQAGVGRVRLGVIRENRRARRFWERAGFREVRRVVHRQGDLVHEVIIMDRFLPRPGVSDPQLGI